MWLYSVAYYFHTGLNQTSIVYLVTMSHEVVAAVMQWKIHVGACTCRFLGLFFPNNFVPQHSHPQTKKEY